MKKFHQIDLPEKDEHKKTREYKKLSPKMKEAVDNIAEETSEKKARLKEMTKNKNEGNYLAQSRWIGIMEK